MAEAFFWQHSFLCSLYPQVDCSEVCVRVQLDHGLGVVDVSFETSMQHDGTPHEPMELVKVILKQ